MQRQSHRASQLTSSRINAESSHAFYVSAGAKSPENQRPFQVFLKETTDYRSRGYFSPELVSEAFRWWSTRSAQPQPMSSDGDAQESSGVHRGYQIASRRPNSDPWQLVPPTKADAFELFHGLWQYTTGSNQQPLDMLWIISKLI